jgi:bile acid:Na+ symporter, BASS family
MFSPKDLLLLAVIFASLFVGVSAPRFSSLFEPYPLYTMMSLLFLSFLSIRVSDIWGALRARALVLLFFLIIRMLAMPTCIGLLFLWLWPKYALAALLLSGISAGVVAPFLSNLVQANSALVLVVVVLSSLLVPFTLPVLVEGLFGRTLEISLLSMGRLLLLVVFIPVFLAEAVRRTAPGLQRLLLRRQYPVSLALFAISNMGVFSAYSDFFRQQPLFILEALGVAFLLGLLYLVAGLLISWGRVLEEQLGAVICFGIMNNVLVIVFSSRFFSPIEPTVAAMYMVPFFGLLLPLRAWRRYKEGRKKEDGERRTA